MNEIIHGDCLEVMKTFPDKSFDLVLTDPPYGIGADNRLNGSRKFAGTGREVERREYEGDEWDSCRPTKEVFDEILRVGKAVLIFGGNFFADLLPPSTHWLVWDKKNTLPSFSDAELVWTNSDRKSVKIIERQYNGLIGKETTRYHPTQKPVDLCGSLIRDYCAEGGAVLDPFVGSGTTAVAAKTLGRNYVGIEISEVYCQIARKRLESVTPAML